MIQLLGLYWPLCEASSLGAKTHQVQPWLCFRCRRGALFGRGDSRSNAGRMNTRWGDVPLTVAVLAMGWKDEAIPPVERHVEYESTSLPVICSCRRQAKGEVRDLASLVPNCHRRPFRRRAAWIGWEIRTQRRRATVSAATTSPSSAQRWAGVGYASMVR